MITRKLKHIIVKEINDLTVFAFYGSVKFEDFMATYSDFYNNNPTKYVIFDSSRGDLDEINFEHADRAAKFLEENIHKRPAGAKTALVVLGTTDYGVVKTYQIILKLKKVGLKTEIFHSYRDAIFWIFGPDHYDRD